MTTAHFVKKARKDYPDSGIKKGESYYWWAFRFGGKNKSKTQPRASQLTQSGFLSTVYGIVESIEDLNIDSNFEDDVQGFIDELESLKSETEDKLSNMPDQLQSAPTGEMMQNRCDSLDEMINDLESVDKEVEDGLSEDDEKERREEILGEIQAISYNGE